MSEVRFPSCVRMVSYIRNHDEIREEHEKHLAFYDAEESDCELLAVKSAPLWSKAKCYYILKVNTYRGWKVYQLHTGCIAAIPEYELEFAAENIRREYERCGLHNVAFQLLPTD